MPQIKLFATAAPFHEARPSEVIGQLVFVPSAIPQRRVFEYGALLFVGPYRLRIVKEDCYGLIGILETRHAKWLALRYRIMLNIAVAQRLVQQAIRSLLS